jgi:3-phenylpropionate/trans-cinnamate dioxygenase ferredoxin subunit
VGVLDDIAAESSVLFVTDDGHPVAVWRLADGRVCATDNLCSHYFSSLHEVGTLSGCEVTCLTHEARFDVTTGAALCPPARLPLMTYEITVDADRQVYVRA